MAAASVELILLTDRWALGRDVERLIPSAASAING
jgi:hypothetical protein